MDEARGLYKDMRWMYTQHGGLGEDGQEEEYGLEVGQQWSAEAGGEDGDSDEDSERQMFANCVRKAKLKKLML